MKSVGAIKHKLNQVRFRYLKKRIEAELRPAPENCRYNSALPAYGVVRTTAPAICLYGAGSPETWEPSYCDRQTDGGARAKECATFCPKRTKDEIKADFQAELERLAIHEVAFHYPDMAALIWVLDADDVGVPDEEAPSTEEAPQAPPPPPTSVTVEVAPEPPGVETPTVPDPVAAVLPLALTPAPKKPWYARLLG